jgi:PAS domain S-box-containing protein
MNFYLLIPATAFLVDFFLMTYLFAASDRHRATRAYLLFCGSITLWQASEFFLWTELPDSVLVIILRLTSPLYLSVGLLFLNFIHDFIQKKRGSLFYIHTAFLLLGVALTVFTDLHIRPVIIRYHWGTTPLPGLLYPHIAFAVMILPAITGLALLARYYRSTGDHIIRRQSLLIFAGLFFTSITGAFANIIVPLWFGGFDFPRLASSLMAIQSIFIFVSIVRYRLFMISFEKNAYSIYNAIQDGVIILDRQGTIHDINVTAARIIGMDEALAKGTLLGDVFPPDFSTEDEHLNSLLEIGPENDRRTVLVSQSTITRNRITAGKLIILKDITAISRAERESRLYQERFTKAFNLSPIPMSINRMSDAVYVDVNESQCRVTGYSREEYLGKRVEDISVFDSRREYGMFKKKIMSQGKVSNIECRFRMKTGEIRYGMLSAEVFSIDGTGYVITCVNDITDRLKMEAEILKTSKLESLGVFAGGIAHDFNNLLTAIIGNISLAKIHGAGNEKSLEVLEEAERASLRAKDLTRQLLTFSRGGAPIKKVMPLNRLLADAANFALRGSAVRCRLGIPEGLWHANIDEGQITQVFHNLVLNARQSMPGGGTIGIDAVNTDISAGEPTGMRPGRYVHICVTDDGEGIDPENISKIFDPFYTTKEKGSGLGLTISYSIIRRHEGQISAESRPGTGTAFHVYLPASDSRAESAGETAAEPVAGRGRILVVDDEDFVLKVAREMLSRMGYDVETALSGDRAIEMYRRALGENKRFDCVIIDLTIRGSMGGLEILTRLREADPGVTAIVSSGYSNDPVMSNYRDHGFSGIVPKPYSYSELESIMKNIVKRS